MWETIEVLFYFSGLPFRQTAAGAAACNRAESFRIHWKPFCRVAILIHVKVTHAVCSNGSLQSFYGNSRAPFELCSNEMLFMSFETIHGSCARGRNLIKRETIKRRMMHLTWYGEISLTWYHCVWVPLPPHTHTYIVWRRCEMPLIRLITCWSL